MFLGDLAIQKEPDSGCLYILSTREWPDVLKVGMTRRTIEERTTEINSATGVAIPFDVRWCWRVKDPAEVERRAHANLSESRLRGAKEFFRTDFNEATRRLGALMEAGNHELRTLGNFLHHAP